MDKNAATVTPLAGLMEARDTVIGSRHRSTSGILARKKKSLTATGHRLTRTNGAVSINLKRKRQDNERILNMGTRADFYVGKGKNAEWIGSIGYDGYPDGIEQKILESISESEFRIRVNERLDAEDGATPDQGWPWPWETSHTTDYSYWFADGKVWANCFGSQFF